jgi:release factor glutamine methyltransferase
VTAQTRAGWLRMATARLAAVPEPAREARLILRWASGLDGAALSVSIDTTPDDAEATRLEVALARRVAREPLSHITGARAFWMHDFAVTCDVLDPRPETECLIALALEGPAPRLMVDAGTGSGCILLSLLAAWPGTFGIGVDRSPAALSIAARNAAELGLAGRAGLVCDDWLAALAGPVDLVVSNPPYLATAELAALAPEVLHEPRWALDGGQDGLNAYRQLSRDIARVLAPGGRALLEIGPTQAEAVTAIFAEAGLGSATTHNDLDGRPRVIVLQA